MDFKILEQAFHEHDGVLKTAQLGDLKVSYRGIQKLMAEGKIEKIKNGYYRLSDSDETEGEIIARLFPDGVLCMNSALYYFQYISKLPLNWDIAIDKNTSKSRFKIDYPYVKPYYVEPYLLKTGVIPAQLGRRAMMVYDKDRLICECLKYESKLERQVFAQAIQSYVKDPGKNVPKLLEYAKMRKVDKRVYDIIGVWL